MNRYIVFAGKLGEFTVKARNKRHAVARVVARLGLKEEQTECVVSWAVWILKGGAE